MARDWTKEIGVTWELLVEAASQGKLLYYSDVAEAIGTVPRVVGANVLEPIQHYCERNSMPPLTRLVVSQRDKKPGGGFRDRGEDHAKLLQEVYDFPWKRVAFPLVPLVPILPLKNDTVGTDIGTHDQEPCNPLQSADFTDFTCIPSTRWEFSPGLNVIVGENGLGKTHVLKAIYSILKVQEEVGRSLGRNPHARSRSLAKSEWGRMLANELLENFRPRNLGHLVKRRKSGKAQVELTYSNKRPNIKFSFSTNSSSAVTLETVPAGPMPTAPVFIPTRELLTLCPWFASLYENRHVPFEKSWRDTVSLLGGLTVRGPKESRAREIVQPIEKAMGGRMEADSSGRFHLKTPTGHRTAAPLVAEGLRKFAMLAHLISTGALLEQGYLLWDEPEANLNPKLIKRLARALVELAQTGVQTFIATHSLFLLREISIIAEAGDGDEKPRYFALVAPKTEQGSAHLEQGDAVEDLKTLVLLDEELRQAQRYLEAHNNAHSHYNWQRKSGTR